MSRKFKEMIFFGSGQHSINEYDKLLGKIKNSFSNLGGLQQHCHCSSKEHLEQEEQHNKETWNEIEDTIKDVIAAFGYDDSIELKRRK